MVGRHKISRNLNQMTKIYLEVSLLVKIDFELDFSALFDLVRKSKISIAITITFPDTHSIVTFRVSNWFFLSFYQHLSNLHSPAVEDQLIPVEDQPIPGPYPCDSLTVKFDQWVKLVFKTIFWHSKRNYILKFDFCIYFV